jgi:hypothetical protein
VLIKDDGDAMMHAAVVETLVEKAKFEPAVAVAVAEAIDMAMVTAPFVTVPILDGRVGELKLEIRDVKVDLVRWVLLAMMSQVALMTGIMYFLLQAART